MFFVYWVFFFVNYCESLGNSIISDYYYCYSLLLDVCFKNSTNQHLKTLIILQRHHLAQSMCILNTEGSNIFENLTSKVLFNVRKEEKNHFFFNSSLVSLSNEKAIQKSVICTNMGFREEEMYTALLKAIVMFVFAFFKDLLP